MSFRKELERRRHARSAYTTHTMEGHGTLSKKVNLHTGDTVSTCAKCGRSWLWALHADYPQEVMGDE